MITKHPLRPERLRQIPPSFSWVDHRLIRHQHLRGCSPAAWALYLFLVTVADAQGLSYYSEAAISRHLNLELLVPTTMRPSSPHTSVAMTAARTSRTLTTFRS